MKQLSNEVKIVKVKAAAVAGTSAVVSDVVDRAGYGGVLFFTTIPVAAAGNYISAQQGTDTAVTDSAAILGTKVVATANNEIVWLDICEPRERYLTCTVERGTSTATTDIFALLYNPTIQPVSNLTTDVIIGEAHVSAAEGAI